MSKLVVYSGPSCVGKGPLREVLERNFPKYKSADQDGQVGRPILYVSRDPNPKKGEGEGNPYHFRSVKQTQAMVNKNPEQYIAGWIRGDEQFQALDLLETKQLLQEHPLVLLEIYDTLGAQLLDTSHLGYLGNDIQTLSVFISPLSMEEINRLKEKGADLSHTIATLMRRKLDRRARDPPEKCQNRASWAYREMQNAYSYAYVISNHDGEDSDNWGLPHHKDDDWTLPYPIGDARKTLETFVELLEKGDSNLTEHWPKDLL